MIRSATALLILLSLASSGFGASSFRQLPSIGGASISLRKRMHINTLITEPGTMEVEWGGLYSLTTSDFTFPALIKYTPEGKHIPWGRTEYSVGFDSITTVGAGAGQLAEFSRAVNLTATSVLHDGEKFDFAVAPLASFFLRDEAGARIGAVAIARYDSGRNSTGATFSWSGATHSSPTNPAGTIDVGLGYARNLSGSDLLSKFTPHVNVLWEKSTGMTRQVSLFEGVEYQVLERLAFDLSAQHIAVAGGATDHQLVLGMTFNLGRLPR